MKVDFSDCCYYDIHAAVRLQVFSRGKELGDCSYSQKTCLFQYICCETCKRIFWWSHNLVQHVQASHGERKFQGKHSTCAKKTEDKTVSYSANLITNQIDWNISAILDALECNCNYFNRALPFTWVLIYV